MYRQKAYLKGVLNMYAIKESDSELKKELYSLLERFAEDNDFIVGMVSIIDTEEKRKKMITYIKENPDDSKEELVACAAYLEQGLEI